MLKLRCSECNTVIPVSESVGQRCTRCHEMPLACLRNCTRPFADAGYQKVHKGRGEEWQASFTVDQVLALRDTLSYWAPGGGGGR